MRIIELAEKAPDKAPFVIAYIGEKKTMVAVDGRPGEVLGLFSSLAQSLSLRGVSDETLYMAVKEGIEDANGTTGKRA